MVRRKQRGKKGQGKRLGKEAECKEKVVKKKISKIKSFDYSRREV